MLIHAESSLRQSRKLACRPQKLIYAAHAFSSLRIGFDCVLKEFQKRGDSEIKIFINRWKTFETFPKSVKTFPKLLVTFKIV